MTEREAQEIVRMVESGWTVDFGQEGRKMWKRMLYNFDPAIGTEAVIKLSERQRQRPTIADLRGMILKIMTDRTPKGVPLDLPKNQMPEWVNVWDWCRNERQPRFMLPFPQQEPYVDPTETITPEQYDELREEWIKAGAPKGRTLVGA